MEERNKSQERVLLVGVLLPNQRISELDDALDELARLAETVGMKVVGQVTQRRELIDVAYFIGQGKAKEIQDLVDEHEIDTVIFDEDLSPGQIKNLERLIGRNISDRTELILEIFARNARSREAKCQVEIAQLQYLLPRLTRRWSHLHRQRGGIGLREAGESQIEIDRRILRERIHRLERELENISSQRETQRKKRRNTFTVALVGYTNAGKSTLLKSLTGSEVLIADRLFATLDSKISSLSNHYRPQVLLIDTVGFIKKLPPHLVASFKSTLEELLMADLLLHVVDLSFPNFEKQIEVTNSVLEELGLKETPSIYVFNKVDLATDPSIHNLLLRRYPGHILVSGLTGEGIEALRDQIYQFFERSMVDRNLDLSYRHQGFLSQVREVARILEENFDEVGIHIRFRTTTALANHIEQKLNEYQASI